MFRSFWKYSFFALVLNPPHPGDSGQTPALSIYLKFAGPTVQITRDLPGRFLGDEYSAPVEEKTNRSYWLLEFVL